MTPIYRNHLEIVNNVNIFMFICVLYTRSLVESLHRAEESKNSDPGCGMHVGTPMTKKK